MTREGKMVVWAEKAPDWGEELAIGRFEAHKGLKTHYWLYSVR